MSEPGSFAGRWSEAEGDEKAKPLAERFKDPSDLLDHLAIRQRDEIDVEAIAEYLGATVVYDELRGAEASIVGRGDRAIITVNCLMSTRNVHDDN